MKLVHLLQAESKKATQFILFMIFIAGITNAGLVAIINMGASSVFAGSEVTWEFMLFLVTLILFMYAKIMSEKKGKSLIEKVMTDMRKRIFTKLMNAPVVQMENMSKTEVITKTSLNISQVLQSSDSIVYGLQAMIMMLSCTIYLMFISFTSFVIVFTGVALIAVIRHFNSRLNKEEKLQVQNGDEQQSAIVNSLLEAFKELKINQLKSSDLNQTYIDLVDKISKLSIRSSNQFNKIRVMSQGMFFLILAIIVFIVPLFNDSYNDELMEITAIVLFIVGYLSGFLEVIPVIYKANSALDSIQIIEEKLDKYAETHNDCDEETLKQFKDFDKIVLKDLRFTYVDELDSHPFSIGPINLTIKRAETLFIVGGNGSGKSTLIKLLTGLYCSNDGSFTIDDEAIKPENVQCLRELYSIILTDFHLLDRFYGYSDVEKSTVDKLIKTMRLDHKVSFKDGKYSTLKLSTGQRKRLALIAAIIEDKDIYVFDEWAADQDQYFREFFYKEIIQDLKNKGKTVIVVTHDEQYWDCSDRLIKLDYGQIVT